MKKTSTTLKKTQETTMKTIAATLAALTMMSPVNLAVYAAEQSDAVEPQAIIAESTASADEAVDTTSQDNPEETTDALPVESTEEPQAEETSAEHISAEPTAAEASGTTEDTAPAADVGETADTAVDNETIFYTITFNTDGGSEIAPITAEVYAPITAPEEPVKEGFTFMGWDTEIPEFMPEKDLVITALWEENKAEYTITFDTDGGNEIAPVTAEAGTAITAPEAPVKDGMYFLSWDKVIPETMPEENITIKAVWSDVPAYDTEEEACAAFEKENQLTKEKEDEDEPVLTATPGSVIYGPMTYDASLCYLSDSSFGDSAAGFGKESAIAMADVAFDMLSDSIPGGKFVMAPFQILFHKGVDDKDPMEVMSEKLDQMDTKLDTIETKIDELANNYKQNTEWIGRKVDNTEAMGNLRNSFTTLDEKIRDLNRDIRAAETNKQYKNKFEKVFMIAYLGTKPTYQTVSGSVYKIQKSMYSKDPAYVSFYDTLYNNKALERYISREAYRDAKAVADDLITEYVSAVMLMQEIETARQAVENFSEEDIAQLRPEIRAIYDEYVLFEQNRQSFNKNDPASALIACANGYNKFTAKYDNGDFIGKGNVRKSFRVDFECCMAQYIKGDFRRVETLERKELVEMVEYIRDNYPEHTLFSFFKEMGVPMDSRFDKFFTRYGRFDYDDCQTFLLLDGEEIDAGEELLEDGSMIGAGYRKYWHYKSLKSAVEFNGDYHGNNVKIVSVPSKKLRETRWYAFGEVFRTNTSNWTMPYVNWAVIR